MSLALALPPAGWRHCKACSTRYRFIRVSPSWSSSTDVAEHLGVKRDTVYRLIRDEGLPAHRVGKFWRFKASQVDAWVERGPSDSNGHALQESAA